jgi:biopolymer transport protein TolR
VTALPRADINVTPMIDVMLVLLIIFMIVTPVINSPVVLPRSSYADPRPENAGDIVLTILRNGDFVLSTTSGAGSTQRVPTGALGERLATLYRTRTRDRILYLKVDTDMSFGPVQDAIEIARKAGVRVVGAVTERQPAQRR